MSRNVSSTLKQAVFAQETDKVFLILLKVNHADLDSPIRVVNNYSNITSTADGGSQEYVGYPFEINLPEDTSENIPEVSLTIDNIDRQIVEAVRTCTGPPTATIWVVLSDSPNTIEYGPLEMTIRSTQYNAMTVTATIAPDNVLNEPYPGDLYSPQNFPGLF